MIGLICLASSLSPHQADIWKPAPTPISTRWAAEVKPDRVLPEYPRPQLVRERWENLNGLWDHAIRPKALGKPTAWDGKILVPFAAESSLSGVGKTVGDANRLWYRRTMAVPPSWQGQRVLLHFGAVDWQCEVFLNGEKVGEHEGGFDSFSIDLTAKLKGPPGSIQEIIVAVYDPTDKGPQPRGKQVAKPEGIWYTPVTGIWQTVWLEAVPTSSITSLILTPDLENGALKIRVMADGQRSEPEPCTVVIRADGDEVARATIPENKEESVRLSLVKPWSPTDPFLYDLEVRLASGDRVTSYFGLRTIRVGKDPKKPDGPNRLLLNGKPLFQFGPLDQGWWPDGLYTAPTDSALLYDIEMTRRLGFNMCRKHVKVEPERWYYHCDKIGLLVWQDMPSGDKNIPPNAPDLTRDQRSEDIYRRELKALIEGKRNHPCIVVWVPFNEGWGQFKTNQILEETKKMDPTRLVDGPSGWNDHKGGDMVDVHVYPGPGMPPLEQTRAAILGEYGGLGLPITGHLWLQSGNWGYQTFKDRQALGNAYKNLNFRLGALVGRGLAAAVYTQTTDVEVEVNGLMTYDRAILKLPPQAREWNERLYQPLPEFTDLLSTAVTKPQAWRSTTSTPAKGWEKPAFNDTEWKESPGGFGTEGTPNARIGTVWNTKGIWLRRHFTLEKVPTGQIALDIHHDEDAIIYLNGVKIAELTGFSSGYEILQLDDTTQTLLKAGNNILAIHCKQTTGGQYIDAGLLLGKTPTKDD